LVVWTFGFSDFYSHEGKGAEKMRAKLWFTILAVAMLAAFTIVVQAPAETMKCRQVQFITKAEVIQVADVPDHIIGIYDQTGLASFDSGDVASIALKGTLDYTKGSGTIQGYTVYTFEDGSTFGLKWQGTTRPDPGGKGSWFESKGIYIQGTGRFAGIQGKAAMTGRRLVPFGGGAQLYSDVAGTYTLPPK
jgi:hypothetical protein